MSDEENSEEDSYCWECSNTGVVPCYCGGDFCICEYQGKMPCDECGDWF